MNLEAQVTHQAPRTTSGWYIIRTWASDPNFVNFLAWHPDVQMPKTPVWLKGRRFTGVYMVDARRLVRSKAAQALGEDAAAELAALMQEVIGNGRA